MIDRPTLDERYSSATSSSDLSPTVDSRCDVDYLIACGWIADGLGPKLVRLASEWDRASGDFRLARARVQRLEREAQSLMRTAHRSALTDKLLAEGAELMRQATSAATTAQVMAMGQLTTLRAAREAVSDYALLVSERQRFKAPARIVMSLADYSLTNWLDGLCSSCSGRGFHGGFGAPLVLCTRCHGSGRARLQSANDRHADFVKALQVGMDRKVNHVQQRMAQWLLQHPRPS